MLNSLEVKNETTLSSIAENPDQNAHYLLFAVIIEISEPMKSEEGSNYLTRVKIIDPSFNYRQDLACPQLKFHKYVHVNIYTETPDDAPKIKFIGDIIRLRRFKFKYSDRGELKAYERKYSNWLIYGGQTTDAMKATSFKNFAKNLDRQLNKYEEGRIYDLRFWADHFFFANSIKYISWWNDIPNIEETPDLAKSKHTEKKKDLILKVIKVDLPKKKLSFIDNKARAFELTMEATPALKVGQIIELKCVDLAWEMQKGQLMRQIKLTQQSSCLLIPAFFWDYRNFEKLSSGEKSGTVSIKKDTQKFAFLNDFTTELGAKPKKGDDKNVVSAVRLSFKTKDVTPIAELLKILNENAQNHIAHKFLIQGHITGFLSLDPTEIIKRYFVTEKRIAKLSEKDHKEKKQRVIYHLVPFIKDDSVKNDQYLQAYILSNEYEHFIFDSWGVLPQNDDLAAWNNVKEAKIQEFIKKLNQLKKPEYKVRLVVQLMMTKSNRFFFKVVDSIFVPF